MTQPTDHLTRIKSARNGPYGMQALNSHDIDWLIGEVERLRYELIETDNKRAKVIDDFRDGPLRSTCLHYGWDTSSSAYIVDGLLADYADEIRGNQHEHN